MEDLLWAVANALPILIAMAISIPWLQDAAEVSRTNVTELPPNNNEEVVLATLGLLREADSEIIMYDDGDTDPESLYQSNDVVQGDSEKDG